MNISYVYVRPVLIADSEEKIRLWCSKCESLYSINHYIYERVKTLVFLNSIETSKRFQPPHRPCYIY